MKNNRLEDLKQELDLKSKDIAEILKVNKSTYSEWEHNKIPIPTRRIIELADFYKVNIDYLLNLTKNRKAINVKTKLDLIHIGCHLKELRKDLGLTLRELGEELNVSYSSLAGYERGEYLINSEILISLCKKYRYSIDWILLRSNEKMINKLH